MREMVAVRAEKQNFAITRQRQHRGRARRDERELGLVVPEAFVRGIRHIGYKSNVEALAELIDNSIQAYAQHVDLVFGYSDAGTVAKPQQLAVIDDGHGMGPQMLRLAMMWGGTHRENDRSGLGRFGYGLPCATVSIGRRFTIYSKQQGEKCYSVGLDLELLDAGGYNISGSGVAIPKAQPAAPPRFVVEAINRRYPKGWDSGTIVVIDKLDRLDWATAMGLRRNLVRHFGVTYHKLLAAFSMHIDGEEVRPIDPLFLDPQGEFHALDCDRAQALDPMTMTIDCGDGVSGDLSLRYSWLPPTFGATDKSRDAAGLNANARFPIIKAYHGLVFSRNGRVIDVQSRTPWTTFINNDRYIRVEVEFSASLDEAFGVTTSKQQVTLTPEMWDRLQTAGLQKAIEHLRSKVRMAKAERQQNALKLAAPNGVGILTSEETFPQNIEGVATVTRTDPHSIRDELAPLVKDAIELVGESYALSALLSRIERRALKGDPKIAAEYLRLIKGWKREMARVQNSRVSE